MQSKLKKKKKLKEHEIAEKSFDTIGPEFKPESIIKFLKRIEIFK
jgi:hypothetical protein